MSEEQATAHEYRLSSIVLCLMGRLGITDITVDPINEITQEKSTLIVQQIEDFAVRIRCMSGEEAEAEEVALRKEEQGRMQ